MSRNLIEHYQDFYRDKDNLFVANGSLADAPSLYAKYDIAEGQGRGWMDMYQINHGLMIGRGQFALNSGWQSDYSAQSRNLSLYIMLSGKVRVSGVDGKEGRVFSSGAMLVHEHCAPMHYEQFPDSPFAGISIEVPAAMADGLHMEVVRQKCAAVSGSPLAMGSLCPQHPCYAWGLQAAQRILEQRTDSVIGRLQIEAAALDLITRLCTGEEPLKLPGSQRLSFRQRKAVTEVQQILESEFKDPHTITSLSRRVQLNECYLKSAFRQATGYTIAEFLRKARMAHARYLIEKHQASVLQAALSVGYSNPSHFSTAFRAVYGVLPSSLKRRLQ